MAPDRSSTAVADAAKEARPEGREGRPRAEGPRAEGRDWRRTRDMGVAALAWIAVVGVVFWGLAHVIGSLLLFILAAILAYALAPAVRHLERFMPRGVAIGLVYLGMLSTLSGLIYLIVITAVGQVSSLLAEVTGLLTPGPTGQTSPLVDALKGIGLTDAQIRGAADRLVVRTQGLAGDVVTVAASVLDAIVRTILVGVLSIYLLTDGPRIITWLRVGTPLRQRPRVVLFVDTLDRVVGGYIRGQLILCSLIGLLVGTGMWALRVPYAVFLGVLAFVLEFVPIIGVFISGAICVALALTQGWVAAVAVLAYFVLVHFVEGDIVGPRVMGRAVGLHPVASIIALFAGAELFGIWGALFASPVAGLIQALLTTFWIEWRKAHPEQFPTGYTVTPDVAIVPVTHAIGSVAAPMPPGRALPAPPGPSGPPAVGPTLALAGAAAAFPALRDDAPPSIYDAWRGAEGGAIPEAPGWLAHVADVAGRAPRPNGARAAVGVPVGDDGWGVREPPLDGDGGATLETIAAVVDDDRRVRARLEDGADAPAAI